MPAIVASAQDMAQAMGQQEIVGLLTQNLQQEQNTLQKVTSASERRAQQLSQYQVAT